MKKLILLFTILLSHFGLISQISTLIPDWAFGGEENRQIVIESWILSGSTSINYGGLNVDMLIDVSDAPYYILPNGQPVGLSIQNLINYLHSSYPNELKLLYFPQGSYLIERQIIIYADFILKGAGGDENEALQTHFHFEFPIGTDGYCLLFSNANRSGIEDIYLADDNAPGYGYYWDEDEWVWGLLHDYKDMVVFDSNTENCWMRGVESYQTRRFHVNIYGEAITISGCYFHDAWDYSDDGGRGYGVCLSDNSLFCRVENNIFRHLRHSMVFQYNSFQNVVAYNYSLDPHGFNNGTPWHDNLSDLCFHGRNDSEYGPSWNLCEGNFVTRIYFDDEHHQNGPFNTIMRCYAADDGKGLKVYKVQGSENQFKQNVVGSRAVPYNNTILQIFTKKWILEYGFADYWDGNPDYSQIPSTESSYYLLNRPPFYDEQISWLPWPYVASGLIPAKYRHDRNNGYYQSDPPCTEVVSAGWNSYNNVCGPPKLNFAGNSTITDFTKEYKAMDYIEAGPYILGSDNSIIFKAENSIVLKPGFRIFPDNNYFYAKVGAVCDGKKSQLFIKNSPEISRQRVKPIKESSVLEDIEFVNSKINNNFQDITVFPNPNTGIFYVNIPYFDNCDFSIKIISNEGVELLEKSIKFPGNIELNINDFPIGMYFIQITGCDFVKTEKIILEK